MGLISYSIHGLVEIQVDAEVNKGIVEYLEFQLGGFKNTSDDISAGYKISIKPYDEFRFEPNATITKLWQVSGVTGHSFNNPVEKFALSKGGNSFTIFTNGRNFPINMFIQFALISEGVSLLPAAGIVGEDNKGILLTGAGATGKTTITLGAVRNGKFRLLGDDTICISENGHALSYPREFTIKEYHRTTFPEYFVASPISYKEKIASFPKELIKQIYLNMPFIGLISLLLAKQDNSRLHKKFVAGLKRHVKHKNILRTVPLETIYGKNKIVSRSIVDRVLYLERYNGESFERTPLDPDTLATRLCAFLHNEWALSARRLYLISALELVDLMECFNLTREIIYSGIKNKQCECLLIPEKCTPEALSEYFLSHCT
jgi:hypothetical protein